MKHEIKYDNATIDGIMNEAAIKKQVEFKYPGYKVTNVDVINSVTYVEFELKDALKR